MEEGVRKSPLAGLGMGGLVIGAIILAAIAFILVSAFKDRAGPPMNTAVGHKFYCTVLSVYDGDGPINCSERDTAGKQVKVRLRGIEARDADNTCRHADLCPKASGADAKAKLTSIATGRLECTSFGPSYDRVDASCRTAKGADISCEMIRSGMAVRWPQYDPDGHLKACIPKGG